MKIKGKNAISLIVLVITILVLSILAATVIISLSNTNIISEASDAVKKTEAQQIEEAKTLMYADGMLGYNPEDQVIGNTTLSWDDESKSVQTKVDTVKIPDGFYYVGGTKETGLVISDNSADANMGVDYTCEGNQFVWVPVEYTATGVTDANGLDTGFTAVFKRGTAEETSSGSGIYKMTGELNTSVFIEPYTGNEWEVEEYYAMCKSVEKYNGFYIARFEAGDSSASSPRTSSSGAGTLVSKKGVYLYNYVSWGDSLTEIGTTGAVYLSKNMYKNSSSVVSTLCYGVQWDVTLNFVSDEEHNITSNYDFPGHAYDITADPDSDYPRSPTVTGSNDAFSVKNIFDLSGNAAEWTMEFATDTTDTGDYNSVPNVEEPCRIWRNGASMINSNAGASMRNGWYGLEGTTDYLTAFGVGGNDYGTGGPAFRVTLYLK